VHPKVLIDDLLRQSKERREEAAPPVPDLFADFNGLPDKEALTEFYQHDANWSNRMILGDSLSVMASLAEREGLRGKVQCIYIDPPYGIRFNSNFQWSTTSRDVKDGNKDHITREPEQVKAFRDTWRDGIHSYLTYLRDRLTVARDLLADSGSIFVQIGDENVHRVRALMDEVFGDQNMVSTISFKKTSGSSAAYLENIFDYTLWYGRDINQLKYRQAFAEKSSHLLETQYTGVDRFRTDVNKDSRFLPGDMSSQGASDAGTYPFEFQGRGFQLPPNTHWKASRLGMVRLAMASRLVGIGKRLRFKRYADDFPVVSFANSWEDTIISGYADPKIYVVQTSPKVIQRCILMTTDPGDLVLDPTCGSGTTAYVTEQWGRRWITIDTSRVALALARARIMGARYPYHLLADSPEGQRKEGEVSRTPPKEAPTRGDIRQGFVYERVPHITLKSIANNAEIDVIWEKWQETLEPLRPRLNAALGRGASFETPAPRTPQDEEFPNAFSGPPHAEERPQGASRSTHGAGAAWEEWEIPREAGANWPEAAKTLHGEWWAVRIARQKEIDASIAAKAEFEYLYDKPYPDNSRIRVAGPFTVESLSPHRVVPGDADDTLIDDLADPGAAWNDFAQMVLDNLRTSGVQQAHKEDRITLHGADALAGQPGLRRRPLPRRGARAPRRDLSRPRIRHGAAPRSRRCGARGGRRPVRRRDRLRLQFRCALGRARADRPHPDPESADEPRPAYGRRAEEHRLGQFVRRLRRARHRDRAGERRPDPGQDQGRRCLQAANRRDRIGRPRDDRIVVYRHRLQRGELLRPPRLFPRRGDRPLQSAEDDIAGRDRRGSLGDSQ
jgi:adenine-specific DNA-methyltransferase